jgi:hypothetical protein
MQRITTIVSIVLSVIATAAPISLFVTSPVRQTTSIRCYDYRTKQHDAVINLPGKMVSLPFSPLAGC